MPNKRSSSIPVAIPQSGAEVNILKKVSRGPKQQAAIDLAREKMKDEPWFRGICLDSLPHEDDVDNIETVADKLVDETFFYDGFPE